MYNKKREIGERLKFFAKKKFGNQAKFARAMGKDLTYFTPYYNGKSYLGGEILSKLVKLGCDINWLLTGEETELQKLKEENEKLKTQLEAIKSMVNTNIVASGNENIVINGSGNSVK